MTIKKNIILLCAALLPALWFVLKFGDLVSAEYGMLRVGLCVVFALLVFFRPKPDDGTAAGQPGGSVAIAVIAGICGALFSIAGLVAPLRPLEWGGILLVVYGCLRWALPARYSRDTAISMVILFLVQPLPGQIVGYLQRVLQMLSIGVAERFLHSANIRAWADGSVLRAHEQVFMVPEACSGMATAVTILICAVSAAVLMRLGWKRGVALVVLGVVQVVLMNGLRIALMVSFSKPMMPEQDVHFLHDSLGVLLIAGVLAVQIEAMWWRRRMVGGRTMVPAPDESQELIEQVTPPGMRTMPRFWQAIMKEPGLTVLVAVLAVLLLFMGYKNRPYHRAQMISGAAISMVGVDNEAAERASEAALKETPDDVILKTEYARMLIVRKKDADALALLSSIPKESWEVQHYVLKAWALQQAGRKDEAEQIITGLPGQMRNTPGVSMVEAEMAAYRGDYNMSAEKLLRASDDLSLIHRVRALYPFMLRGEKWDVIIKTDANLPYRTIESALAAGFAYLKLNDIQGLAKLLLRTMGMFPNDPRLLRYYFLMASMRPGSQWEDMFAEKFGKVVSGFVPDELAMYAEKAFRIRRPDLAWLAYSRLREMDPMHPYVYFLPAAHGKEWFMFRKRYLGMGTGFAEESVAVTPRLYRHVLAGHGPWDRKWTEIPLVEELGDPARAIEFRRKSLDSAIAEFAGRLASGRLSIDMRYGYATALEMAGRIEDARAEMEKLSGAEPAEKGRTIVHTAEMYSKRGDWERLYETVWKVMDDPNPSLRAMLLLCEANLRLKSGLQALASSQRAVSLFPQSGRAFEFKVSSINSFLGPEDAFFELNAGDRTVRDGGRLSAEIHYRTGRLIRAGLFNMVDPLELPEGMDKAQMMLPEAENALGWYRVALPTEAEFKANEAMLEIGVETSVSPFLRQLSALWLDCYRSNGAGLSADPVRWADCGRNRHEKATALHQLVILQARAGKFPDAEKTAEQAVKYVEDSPLLWRCLIGVTDGRSDVVERAFAACPTDSEIWLSYLVTGVKEGRGEAWVYGLVTNGLGRLPAGTMTRAADFLLRKGLADDAAVAAAVYAEKRADGLVPAYVMAAKCAQKRGDRKWELSAIAKAIEYSSSPDPYLCGKLIELKGEIGKPDADVLNALERLHSQDPGNAIWIEKLGYVRFMRGGVEMSMSVDRMSSVMVDGCTNKTVFLVAAEAHRRLGDREKAVAVLKKALALMPGDGDVVNNLVYTLAGGSDTMSHAVEMLPVLAKVSRTNDLHVLDTFAYVYIQAGKLDLAEQAINRILEIADENNPAAERARLRLAEIEYKAGNMDKAKAILGRLISGSGRKLDDEELYDLGRLMRLVEAKSKEY